MTREVSSRLDSLRARQNHNYLDEPGKLHYSIRVRAVRNDPITVTGDCHAS